MTLLRFSIDDEAASDSGCDIGEAGASVGSIVSDDTSPFGTTEKLKINDDNWKTIITKVDGGRLVPLLLLLLLLPLLLLLRKLSSRRNVTISPMIRI